MRYPGSMASHSLYLASVSPRRRELLDQIGVPYRAVGADVDETPRPGESPDAYVLRLASAKAGAVEARLGTPAAAILGADTTVVLDGRILGKPVDAGDALSMLGALSGRTHVVLTAVALHAAGTQRSRLCRSEVAFRELGDAECREYWESGEPRDKAGAYAIQGFGAVFVRELRGSYSGVMGLPLYETAELLREAGMPLWRRA